MGWAMTRTCNYILLTKVLRVSGHDDGSIHV
jgi:hypothetical protein